MHQVKLLLRGVKVFGFIWFFALGLIYSGYFGLEWLGEYLRSTGAVPR